MADFMDGLRSQARRLIGGNALAHVDNVVQPDRAPQKQWWNLPAKYQTAARIQDEEAERAKRLARPLHAHNNELDALRHARASARVATEVDPIFSALGGIGHEGVNFLEGAPVGEILMDLRNNSEGLQAAAEGRQIDPRKLQTRPLSARAAYSRSLQAYDDASLAGGEYPPLRSASDYDESYDPEERYPARHYRPYPRYP